MDVNKRCLTQAGWIYLKVKLSQNDSNLKLYLKEILIKLFESTTEAIRSDLVVRNLNSMYKVRSSNLITANVLKNLNQPKIDTKICPL